MNYDDAGVAAGFDAEEPPAGDADGVPEEAAAGAGALEVLAEEPPEESLELDELPEPGAAARESLR